MDEEIEERHYLTACERERDPFSPSRKLTGAKPGASFGRIDAIVEQFS